MNTSMDEWQIVYKVHKIHSGRKIYHVNRECPQLAISYKVNKVKLGSMLAGQYRRCTKC